MGSIIVPVVFVAVFVSVFLVLHRTAVRNSRRIGAPPGQAMASFAGGMWRPGKLNAGPGTVRLEFFDWGVRLGSSGTFNLVFLGLAKLLVPVWEARYDELAEARLVTAPSHRGVRLRAAGSDHVPVSDDVPVGDDLVMFWTDPGSEVLDRLQEHAVSVDRAADQVPDPPPIRISVGRGP